MALRVTQSQMYSTFVSNMNTNLADLMESNMQSSSQLRINRPSDDAAGAGKIVMLRKSLANIGQYKKNMDMAEGWLATADKILAESGSVMTALTRIKELATQGATGTYDGMNREQMSYAIKEAFRQIINLSNTTFEGRHIFSGHKTDKSAYIEGLAVTCNDAAFAGKNFQIEGSSQKTVLFQATSSGTSDTATYRVSSDGGTTWQTATVDATLASPPYEANKMRISGNGVSIVCDKGVNVTAVDPENKNELNNGTWMYVRPTAIYQGDDNENQVVGKYGTTTAGTAEGHFLRDVTVRIDNVAAGLITYSYSTDDGGTWAQATAPDTGATTQMPVPGGYLKLQGSPAAGEEYIIHPHRADISFAISEADSITVNFIGKNVFGGVYNTPGGPGYPTPVPGEGNLFEVVGRLIGYAETNSQEGMQKALDELDAVMNKVLTAAAVAGGRENRLTITQAALAMRKFDEEDNMSRVADVDVTELMTKLAQQQVAYNSVLKSSSMIMQMSLVNFL